MSRGRGQAGFTLIEILASTLLLAVGLLSTAMVVDGARDLTSVSERTAAMTHRAEDEIERVRALGYAAIAMDGAPSRSSDPADPSSVLTAGDPPGIRPDRASLASEPLVVDTAQGRVSATPRTWDDGRLHGTVRVYVSWHADGHCGSGCPTSRNTKRITVAVTSSDSAAAHRGPVWLSTIVADPSAAPAGLVEDGVRNPLADPETRCQPDSGPTVPCTSSIGSDSAAGWFLYDTPATKATWTATGGDHPTHPTIAPTGLCSGLTAALAIGCPVPDLMGEDPTPSDGGDRADPPPDRSTDQGGSAGSGGRVLRRDVSCGGSPSSDNHRSQLWVTPPQAAARTLTGSGGMTLFTRTAGGATAAVTLCVRFYVVPGSILNLIAMPPVALGTVSYALAAWPGVTTPVSFTFSLPGSDLRIGAGERLGVRIWVAASAESDVVVAYDDPALQSSLQVNLR